MKTPTPSIQLFLFSLALMVLPFEGIGQQNPNGDHNHSAFPQNHNFEVHNLYNVGLKLMDNRSFKGLLLEASDSTLLVATTKLPAEYISGNYQIVSVPVSRIKRLTLKYKDNVNQRITEHTADGILGIWEEASYSDMPQTPEGCCGCLLLSVIVGGTYGVIRGLATGKKKERYFIDGNYINYNNALGDLQYYSAYLE